MASFSERKGSQVPVASSSSTASAGGQQLFKQQAAPFASLSFALSASNPTTNRRIRFGALPFASLSSSAHPPSASFAHAQTEAATGTLYPSDYCILTKSHCPQLAGVGVRAKRILGLKNINVYTVGLYVDGPHAKKALSKWKGSEVDGLLVHQEAFDDLVSNTHFEKSLRLVISFGALKRSQFVSALEERLKPALDKAKEPASTLKSFEALFDGVTFRKGMEVGFASHHKGQLVTQIDGKQVGSINSPALVKALFDIYVGPDPVSSEAKRSFGKGLAALLNE